MRALTLAFTLVVLIASARVALAVDPPKLNKYVTDLAGVMTESETAELNNLLAAYDKETANQFVVLIISSLEGESLEDFSLAVAEKNRIGRKGNDNGLLLLIAVQDRKLRFEVGYGLEDVLTDATTSIIIQDVIAPQFKAGNFTQGVNAGINAAIQAASGTFTPPPRWERSSKGKGGGIGSIIAFIIFAILFLIIGRRRRSGGVWFIGGSGWGGHSGGGWGGGGGGGFSGGGGSFGGGGSSGSW